jgi:Leucine-rich repeat (LRR) protein
LRQHLGVEDLTKIDYLELIVSDEDQRLNSIGENMSHLERLKLNDSNVPSLRDLGTRLTNLKVLWLNRSGLQDVGGISGLPVLEELYVAFNDVTELAPMAYHDRIHTLDLEGNNIESENELKQIRKFHEINQKFEEIVQFSFHRI